MIDVLLCVGGWVAVFTLGAGALALVLDGATRLAARAWRVVR